MKPVEKALQLALEIHAGQTDLAGAPYIMHIVRVMAGVKYEGEQIVAALHDVMEDGKLTAEELRVKDFMPEIVEAVVAITKRKGEDYRSYIDRVKQNQLARAVKLADLKDNSDLSRLRRVTKKDYARNRQYHAALEWLRF